MMAEPGMWCAYLHAPAAGGMLKSRKIVGVKSAWGCATAETLPCFVACD